MHATRQSFRIGCVRVGHAHPFLDLLFEIHQPRGVLPPCLQARTSRGGFEVQVVGQQVTVEDALGAASLRGDNHSDVGERPQLRIADKEQLAVSPRADVQDELDGIGQVEVLLDLELRHRGEDVVADSLAVEKQLETDRHQAPFLGIGKSSREAIASGRTPVAASQIRQKVVASPRKCPAT